VYKPNAKRDIVIWPDWY